MSEETVTIPMSEYQMLKKDQVLLRCLHEGGVDNWDWYGEAYREYLDVIGENDD